MKISKSELAELCLSGVITRPGQSWDWPMEIEGKYGTIRVNLVRVRAGLVDGHYEVEYRLSEEARVGIAALEALLPLRKKKDLHRGLAKIADSGR